MQVKGNNSKRAEMMGALGKVMTMSSAAGETDEELRARVLLQLKALFDKWQEPASDVYFRSTWEKKPGMLTIWNVRT